MAPKAQYKGLATLRRIGRRDFSGVLLGKKSGYCGGHCVEEDAYDQPPRYPADVSSSASESGNSMELLRLVV